ncbi:MAG TPA: flagellar cap protein [Spongiibacteraceae bacterium]|nr:flagellar cap protein [Spongiibacteraceae bacterium]HCS26631.1 flagellar cap protein [Spongiibacteraceae bacterium]
MAQIISSGIGSGLDITGLVSQLVQAERGPAENRLNTSEVRAQSRLSAFGSLKSALSSFQSSLDKLQSEGLYQARKASVSDKDLFTVSSQTTASAGNYSIQSEQLASRHKIASAAYADDDASVGTGTLNITVNGDTLALTIDAAGDSLAEIRDAINEAPANPGVTASIIRDEDGSHLVFSATETGAANTVTVSVTTDVSDTGNLAALTFDPLADPQTSPMAEKQAAVDAMLVIDGFTAFSSNNVFDEVLEGVSITLKDSDPGNVHTLDVSRDESSVKKSIQQFVDAYNSLRSTIDTLTAYNAETGQAGLLQGDSTTARLSAQLRQSLTLTISGANRDLDTLAEIGISTNFETGRLEIDNDTLDSLVTSNFGDFSALFAGDSGFAAQLDSVADVYSRFDGILDTRSNGINAQIDRINSQRDALNTRMVSVEARYLAQFTALDGLLGELNQTSNFLTTQLGNLPTFNQEK